ncbi:MAG: 30S ribosomal protein S3ae [Thaumarchaeota archaeon]|nr:30S ribosomal protein S3ae [Nitrososphaerota archaeon]
MSSRRARERWRSKLWITVYAPPYFGDAKIAYIPVTDPKKAVGRVIETTLYDLIGQDMKYYSIKLYFKITEIDEEKKVARTIFKGHEYAREYLRSLVRRRTSMVDFIKDYRTKDGYVVRIFTVAFTQHRINTSKKHKIRLIADRILSEKVPNMTYDQLAHALVLEKLASDILGEAKKIARIRHLGIRKSKLIKVPEEQVMKLA